jgi:serine/threonine protein kinase
MSAIIPELSQGDRIGPYALLRPIGRGQASEVWLAERDSPLAKTRLALKLMRENTDLQAICQETRLWTEIPSHPNVLPLFEANVYGAKFVLVTEYVADGSLEDWIGRHGGKAPTVAAAAQVALGVLAGLGHLHAEGIIHRDIKPANVLMHGDTPRLADFGLARKPTLDGSTCRIAGTPFYMAPEAFDGMRTRQTDIWSVGVLFHQLLSGRLPFDGQELSTLISAIRTLSPAPLPPGVPGSVQHVLFRSLEKDFSGRYATALEMSSDLRKCLGKVGVDPPDKGQDRQLSPDHGVPAAYLVLEVEGNGRKGGPRLFDPAHDRRIIIGRGPECDLCLAETSCSRKHAMILFDREQGWILQDLNSRNGLGLNGEPVRNDKRILKAGDQIGIGSALILVRDLR